MNMPTKGQKTTVHEDGVDKEAYVVAFTNGAFADLEELRKKFQMDDVDMVIKVAIGLLKRIPGDLGNGSEPSEPAKSK